MDPVRKKDCPVSLCMPGLEHLERIAMFLRPPARPACLRLPPAPAAPARPPRPAPAGAGGADGGEKIFAGQAGVYISQ